LGCSGQAKVVLVASIAMVIAWLWDISRHLTVGASVFWALPHMALYLSTLIAGLAGWRLGVNAGQIAAIGLPNPGDSGVTLNLGAWLSLTGACMALATAIFDHRWQTIRAPDVAVLTPPFAILACSILIIQLGVLHSALLLRKGREVEKGLLWSELLLICSVGIIVLWISTIAMEYVGRPNLWRGSEFYVVSGALFPFWLIVASRSSRFGWPATSAAGFYMAITLAVMWLLQAIPAPPQINPIYRHITHMIPPPFPLLLVFPAFAVDLVSKRIGPINGWTRRAILTGFLGPIFVGISIAVHWGFSVFLLSPAGRGYLCAADQWPFHAAPGEWQYQFWTLDAGTRPFAAGILLACVLAIASLHLGDRWSGTALFDRRSPGE
jgi:hypothetical protein